MKKILLVEDDLILGESLEELLSEEGFDVVWVKDGNEAIDQTYDNIFDLYLFDVDIPFINGFELLKSLRDISDKTPCIFLTAKVGIKSLSIGFDVGADDYIKKPFDIDELIVRINTQIKKSFNTYSKILSYGDITYDISNKLITKNHERISLSPTELKLFELFLKNINKSILKEDILYHLNNSQEGSEAVLRVQISKLKKIGLNIINQRAVGYRLEEL
ncbi:MAG: response regulator transcription factor [Campylobacteraceae bacterium]|jgi:DNA-binding response OmpR family regulator|nr:response regulator transcription factor [Campylobacteraceae bacterium]MBT4029916.1 response regulator transcription factor [Campylobacteraceae bacterium]MBT4572531.1 response regulator transcription factor [Campylobacteraceae bacterium]MBT4707579.1 response regulator transcription factor [Campylobacteraceae bacterium]MBT5324328.1 response regulator transcription factor [Campylobacteraceae bacterium]